AEEDGTMRRTIAWLRSVGWSVRRVFRSDVAREELDDELRFHLEMAADAHRRRGLSPEEALRAARRDFGGVDQVKETIRARSRLVWVEDTLRDLGLAVRG